MRSRDEVEVGTFWESSGWSVPLPRTTYTPNNFQGDSFPIPIHAIISSMASTTRCTRSSRALRSVWSNLNTRELILPAFLVPAYAFTPLQRATHFSSSTRCKSKIGRTPLSLPPEVTFRILEPKHVKQGNKISRSEPSRTVEIEGPLGKMAMEVPPYVQISSNEESRTHSLSILDAKDKKQKAMWGE